VTLAETALTGARGLQIPTPASALHVRQAYALAAVHDTSGCVAAIFKDRTQVEQFESDNDAPWLYWVSPAWILVEAGDSMLQLGQADRTATMLDEGVALFDGSFARDRQIYSIHLANALARPGKQRDLDAESRMAFLCSWNCHCPVVLRSI
jgi:hypothetical protein